MNREQTAKRYLIPLDRLETDRHRRWRHLVEALLLVYFSLGVVLGVFVAVGGGVWQGVIGAAICGTALYVPLGGWMVRYKEKAS